MAIQMAIGEDDGHVSICIGEGPACSTTIRFTEAQARFVIEGFERILSQIATNRATTSLPTTEKKST